MTQLDVVYRYGAAPSERAQLALSKVRDVYGVRRVEVREAEKTVRVEYDASRLSGAATINCCAAPGWTLWRRLPGSAQAGAERGRGPVKSICGEFLQSVRP